MTRHDDSVSFRQMLDHAREAATLAANRKREDLDSDRVLCLALIRLVEIVGEAAGRISKTGRERHADVPWESIIGLRNRLIHGYDAINHDMLWQILSTDLPVLVETLDAIVNPRSA